MASNAATRSLTILTMAVMLLPVCACAAEADSTPSPTLSATAIYVESLEEGTVLLEREADRRIAIASLAKLMTGILVCRYAEPESDTLVVTPYAVSQLGRMGGLRPGEAIGAAHVLAFTVIESSNDGATALAEYFAAKMGLVGKGEDVASDRALPERRFVDAMNREASVMALTNTAFANPHGLDAEGGYITARDAAALFKAFIGYPLLSQLSGTALYECASADGTVKHRSKNRNQMLDPAAGILAGKTGTTAHAGEHLVVLWQPPATQERVVAVVLGSTNRYADMAAVLSMLRPDASPEAAP